jgi:hypothetical protein
MMSAIPPCGHDHVRLLRLRLSSQFDEMSAAAAFPNDRLNPGAPQHLKRLLESAASCLASGSGIKKYGRSHNRGCGSSIGTLLYLSRGDHGPISLPSTSLGGGEPASNCHRPETVEGPEVAPSED